MNQETVEELNLLQDVFVLIGIITKKQEDYLPGLGAIVVV